MSGYKTHRLSQEPDDFDGPWPEENAMTTEWKVVPIEPTAEQSDELARDIIMWWSMSPPTGDALYRHLKRLGRDVPPWLPTMIRDAMYVPPKGVVTMVIYRAMLDAAPAAPTPLDSSVIREGMRQLELRRERLAEIKERIAGLGQEQGEPEPVSFLDQVRENMEAMGAALGQLTEQEKRAPARREEMAAFAAELKADPAKAQRFFQGAGILDASGNLTPQYGGPVAWRIFDGEGGYDYLSDGPTDEQSAWGERWGRKYEPLYLHPSRANDETLKWQLIGSELLAQDMHKRIEQLKLQSAAAELVHRETATTVLTQMAEIERLRPDAQRYRYVVHTAPRSKIVPLFESGYTDAEIEALIDKMRSEQ